MTRYSAHNVTLLFLIATALRQAIVGSDESLTTGLVAVTTLFAENWLLSTLTRRSRVVADVLQGPVATLLVDGKIDEAALRRHRISEDDLRTNLRRAHGREDLSRVKAAYIERSGALTFVLGD
jgi:uncharacterized membrane protein YcaP (DUF421 family)